MYQTDYDMAPRGWVCPKCGRVYSPSTSMCSYCGGGNTSQPATTETILNDKDWWESYLKQTITDTETSNNEWWKEYLNHNAIPDTIGGSDYWNNSTKTWENVPYNLTNNYKDEGEENDDN